MLKPIHIICLFVLLGLGLSACKKEKGPNYINLPFTIREITTYDSGDYFVKTETNSFVNDTLRYDVDGDGIFDMQLHKESSTDNNGSGSNTTYLYSLYNNDHDFLFSSTTSNSSYLVPHQTGDTIAYNTALYSNNWWFAIFQYQYTPLTDYYFSWNSNSSTKVYIGFRKLVGDDYKYGWIKFENDVLGPSVIER